MLSGACRRALRSPSALVRHSRRDPIHGSLGVVARRRARATRLLSTSQDASSASAGIGAQPHNIRNIAIIAHVGRSRRRVLLVHSTAEGVGRRIFCCCGCFCCVGGRFGRGGAVGGALSSELCLRGHTHLGWHDSSGIYTRQRTDSWPTLCSPLSHITHMPIVVHIAAKSPTPQ